MMFTISKEAEKDLRAIGRHTQQKWGADQRRKYLSGIERQFHFLASNPLACPERGEFTPAVRIHHHGSHLIVYTAGDAEITILRVLHQQMDTSQHLTAYD